MDSLDGRPTQFRTTARIVWDDEALYVAFDCEDPDVWGTFTNRDDPLYTQEVVEIFVDADADGRTYDEIEVSPHNVVFDAYFPARRQGMDTSWDSGLQSAVKVPAPSTTRPTATGAGRWRCASPSPGCTAVPHIPPSPGDRWRFNLYRLDLPDRKNAQGQAFSPLFVGDFHAVDRFAWLVFDTLESCQPVRKSQRLSASLGARGSPRKCRYPWSSSVSTTDSASSWLKPWRSTSASRIFALPRR